MLDVEGMKCAGCISSVEQIIKKQPNVLSASVNLVTGTAWIDFDEKENNLDPILKTLSENGFPAKQRTEDNYATRKSDEFNNSKNWWKQWRQLIVALTLLILSILGHLVEAGKFNIPIIGNLSFHAFLATYALLGPGWSILKKGFLAGYKLSPNMDSLVGLGVGSAYIASLVALIWPKASWPCFFNEPVMLLGFVLVGRFLEERARYKTNKALEELAQLQPENARLIVNENEIREVRVGALKPGETIQILAGDRVPVDGIVLEGYSAVDVSSLTGESVPLNAIKGTELSSGSLNLESTLIFKVTKTGAESALARILSLVEEAQSRKAPIQGLADFVAGKFCIGVSILSLSTFIFWWKIGSNIWPNVLNITGQGFNHNHNLHSALGSQAQTPLGLALQLSIAVLVIACPCALGLATPTVITVSSGLAAKRGWLFRGGDVIETAAAIKKVIFDKTGTLTIGKPQVVKLIATDDPAQLIKLSASIEKNSRHPISHAILQKALQQNIDPLKTKSAKTIVGCGIEGELNDFAGKVYVGKPDWIKDKVDNWDLRLESEIESSYNDSNSIIGVAHNRNLLGLISINDELRKDAIASLQRLKNLGLNFFILSGDKQKTVKKLAENLGIGVNQLGWELLPDQKLNKIRELQAFGKVAMVGDGINDAPALAAADIGIAVGTGTQIAKDTADLVLLGDRLEALPEAIILAKNTMVKVKQNLFWAFGYNFIALPVAAGVLLPKYGLLLSPPLAAFLMAMSSITVVVNALSLRIK